MDDTVCICCGGILIDGMCPERYQSDHGMDLRLEVAMVAVENGWKEGQAYDREAHMQAVKQAKENLENERSS